MTYFARGDFLHEQHAKNARMGTKGSFETFAASRPNVGNGVKGRLCADVLVIPIM